MGIFFKCCGNCDYHVPCDDHSEEHMCECSESKEAGEYTSFTDTCPFWKNDIKQYFRHE